MAYVPKFTTKDNVHALFPKNLKLIHLATDIPDIVMKRGESLVLAELKKNGRYSEENIDFTDINLVMAAEYAVLWQLQVNQTLPGIYGRSGELSNSGAAGINVSYTGSKGGNITKTQEIEQEFDAPDYYHAFQRSIIRYLQNPNTKGDRIDEVEPRLHNAFDDTTERFVRNGHYDPFSPHR